MAESLNFAAPARTRVLVVPLNKGNPDFQQYYDKIRSANDIRLLDVAPLPEARNFNPQAFPQGRILYDFCASPPDEDVLFLHDFEPFRKTFIVLGVGSYEDFEENAVEKLSDVQPTAIVHNCIYFNSPADKIESQKHASLAPQDVFFVPSLEDQNITTLETTMCYVTELYLKALASYVSSYEKITLRSPVSLRDGTALHKTITYAQKKVTSGSSFKVSFSKNQTLLSTPDLKVKASQRQTGRQAKLMGNFLLLAGQANDALQYFTDAAINLKKSDDNLWLGSALEGLAVSSLMLSYLGIPHQALNPMLASVLHIHKNKLSSITSAQKRLSTDSLGSKHSNGVLSPRNSTSKSRSSTSRSRSTSLTSTSGQVELSGSSITEFLRILCNKTAMFYSLSDSDFENGVPDLVYIEFLLRSIKLFINIYQAGAGSELQVLEATIKSAPLDSVSHRDPVLRSEILALIDQIFSMQLIDLEFFKQCRVYYTLAIIYSDLGLRRKRAFILRILLVALLPKLNHNAHLPDFITAERLTEIFEFLFEMYSIGRQTEAKDIEAAGHYSDWITLQLLLLKICLRITESLKDYEMLAKICVLILSRYTHCLPNEDQIKLKRKMDWLALLSKESHNSILIPHPDPFMVRNAKFVLQLQADELVPFQTPPSTTPTSGNDPLIFNPFSKVPKDLPSKDKLICVNDIHQVVILLQNPFAFDLNVSDISIVADDQRAVETVRPLMRVVGVSGFNKQDLSKLNGMQFHPSKLYDSEQRALETTNNVVVPPSSLCHVVIAFKITQPGVFKISEFDVTFGTSEPQRFSIIDLEKSNANLRLLVINPTKEDPSNVLDKCADNLQHKNVAGRATTRRLTLTVIPSQASLSLVANLISNGWLMLLEGEKKEFSIKLKNTSNIPINYLSFSFWDSTNDSINSRLNHAGVNQLSAEEVHELEWQLLENKPFTVVNKQEISSKYKIIQPLSIVEFQYQINGKRGMAELRLILEYCNRSSDEKRKNYIKTISVPLNITVQPSLEIIGCDVIPFFSTSLQGFQLGNHPEKESFIEKNISDLLKFISKAKESDDDDISQYCLLVLDVRNLWKEKLALKITNEVQSDMAFVVNEKIESTKTSRLLLPIRRMCLEDVDVSRPIPSLRKKQYVKNYSITAEEDEQNRKNFWIRSFLLQCLEGSWHTVTRTSPRSGTIDLRNIRLDSRMANALVYDNILIQHSIWSVEGTPGIIDKKENEYSLDKERFYTLKTKIVNHTKTALSGVLRHVPFPTSESNRPDISIDQRILFNGVLQKTVGPKQIAPSGHVELELGFMVLEKGKYEWGCVFDDFNGSGKKTVGREPVYITVV